MGVAFGGAIGVVFYLAQAISVSMYVIGFTEAFVDSFPTFGDNFLALASFVNLVTFVCVYIGAGWAIRVQYFILAVLAAALISFYIGAGAEFDMSILKSNMHANFAVGQNFFTMFALFFPAVTGIMAGANMSGDLANPAKAIPKGTLWAVLVTAIIYLSQIFFLAGSREQSVLVANNLVIKDISLVPMLIVAGVFAATLSSALGSMMGAPRILQAFARDEVFNFLKFFSAGSGQNSEPRRAVVLTFIISQNCILLGNLDAIAPIITMFFMLTYGLLNLATFYEAFTKNPSYRPTFRYCHWSVSLAGAVGCIAVMFLINPIWALVSLVMIFCLHWYIKYHEIEGSWGDLQSGVSFERARKSLLRLEEESYHPKNWRPIILALSSSTWTKPHLAIFGHWLAAGRGVITVAQVVTGEVEDYAERRLSYERTLRKFLASENLQAFPAVVVDEDLASGINSLIQCHGIGGLRPNTVLIGWPSDKAKFENFCSTLRLLVRMRKSTLVMRFSEVNGRDPWEVPSGTIDVWWRGKENGALMLLLAHLLHQNPEWRANKIRLMRSVTSEEGKAKVMGHLKELSVTSRINAQIAVVNNLDFLTAIKQTSANSALVILGFHPPEPGQESEFFSLIENLGEFLPRILLVDSAGGMELET
jgi:amino acid transporter